MECCWYQTTQLKLIKKCPSPLPCVGLSVHPFVLFAAIHVKAQWRHWKSSSVAGFLCVWKGFIPAPTFGHWDMADRLTHGSYGPKSQGLVGEQLGAAQYLWGEYSHQHGGLELAFDPNIWYNRLHNGWGHVDDVGEKALQSMPSEISTLCLDQKWNSGSWNGSVVCWSENAHQSIFQRTHFSLLRYSNCNALMDATSLVMIISISNKL